MNDVPVAGIDVSKDFSDMCILAPDNTIFRRIKIYHDLTSMKRSLTALQNAEKQFGAKPILVMESTSHYHRLIWQFMTEAGFNTIVINPLQSAGLKNINVRKVKNDKIDAYKLALLYRLKELRSSIMPVGAIASLRALSRQHADTKQDVTRYTNRLTAILDQAFPGYAGVFSEITIKSSLAILDKCPTPRDLLSVPYDDILSTLMLCRRGAKWARTKADKLIEVSQNAVWLSVCRAADAILVRSCISTLYLLSENIQKIDDEIHRVLSENEQVAHSIGLLKTIPGIGEYSAVVLLSEMGDPAAFKKPKQLTAFFGLDPSERQSGKFKGTKNKISKRGSRYVRGILNMIAHNCIHTNRAGKAGNPILAEYYMKKLKSKPHKVAICAVMHKVINIVFAVLRDQKPFELRDPKEHDRILKASGIKAVA